MALLKAKSIIGTVRRAMGYVHTNRDQHWVDLIGDREMVTYGMNGLPMYIDAPTFPFPAIRYKEMTLEIEALNQKQTGDWRYLSFDEKKTLYRWSFCQTYSEFKQPIGQWMEIAGYVLILCACGFWLFVVLKLTVPAPRPDSFSASRRRAQLRRQIDLQVNPIEGLASWWDYEKMDWKVRFWDTPDNPFVKCDDDEP